MKLLELPEEIQEISVLRADVDELIEKYSTGWLVSYRAAHPPRPICFHKPIHWDVDYTGYFKGGPMRVFGGEVVIDRVDLSELVWMED